MGGAISTTPGGKGALDKPSFGARQRVFWELHEASGFWTYLAPLHLTLTSASQLQRPGCCIWETSTYAGACGLSMRSTKTPSDGSCALPNLTASCLLQEASKICPRNESKVAQEVLKLLSNGRFMSQFIGLTENEIILSLGFTCQPCNP